MPTESASSKIKHLFRTKGGKTPLTSKGDKMPSKESSRIILSRTKALFRMLKKPKTRQPKNLRRKL